MSQVCLRLLAAGKESVHEMVRPFSTPQVVAWAKITLLLAKDLMYRSCYIVYQDCYMESPICYTTLAILNMKINP